MEMDKNETEIISQWIFDGYHMQADENGKRIDWLIHHCLKKIALDYSGWEILYQDPADKRYWELTYPKGEMQGGGPPMLALISEHEMLKKYKI